MSVSYFASTCLRFKHLSFTTRPLLRTLPLSTSAMSYRPNYQGGRRGGGRGGGAGRGGGGRGRGGRGGGGGEQRWWDPVWRAERLRQQAAELEVLDVNEWRGKMEQVKRGAEQEMVFKCNFGRRDQETLSDMAAQLGLHFHAYNKGKALVVSKVPLPDYRADLDKRHGSTQKEIQMSSEIEKRVGTLLDTSTSSSVPKKSVGESSQKGTQSALTPNAVRTLSISENSAAKEKNEADREKINVVLKQREERIKASDSVKAMLSFRGKLPAFNLKSEFLKAVAENQVLVVSGETGCGKTTQLPQFILEEEIQSSRGADCNMTGVLLRQLVEELRSLTYLV